MLRKSECKLIKCDEKYVSVTASTISHPHFLFRPCAATLCDSTQAGGKVAATSTSLGKGTRKVTAQSTGGSSVKRGKTSVKFES